MKKINNVLFAPKWDKANPYQSLLKKGLESQGIMVDLDDYPDKLLPLFSLKRKHSKVDAIHIHWVAPILMKITWSDKKIAFFLKCSLLVLDCLLVRAFGTRLIWTVHNKFSHDTTARNKEIFVRRILYRCVSRAIVHSEQALELLEQLYKLRLKHKTSIVFHGNYSTYYPTPTKTQHDLKKEAGFKPGDIVVGFFGAIRKYKGIESIVRVAHMCAEKEIQMHFIISGSPLPEEYGDELLSQIKSENIQINLEYLSDQALVDNITMADVVILPFTDTLTSGSAILTMTLGRGLLLPDAAKVFGCVPNKGAIYFSDDASLLEILEKTSVEKYASMGFQNKAEAQKMTWDKAGELTAQVYRHQ